jgi:hypothetical protein
MQSWIDAHHEHLESVHLEYCLNKFKIVCNALAAERAAETMFMLWNRTRY